MGEEAFGATSSGSSSAWSKPRGQLELSGVKPKMAHCREDNARKRRYSQVEERNGSASGPELVTRVRGSEDGPLPILKGKSLAGKKNPQE